MLSDRHTKEPESIFNRRDDHIVTLPSPLGSAPMRLHVHRHPSRIHQSCFSHPEHPTRKCFTQPWGPSHGASPNHGVLHTGSTFLGVPHTMFTGAPPMTSQQGIPLLTPFVAKGERGHPTRTRTQVYRVPNMHSDRNAKEPGSMAWQSEHILICSDDHIITRPSPSGSAPLCFTQTGIPCASTNCTSPIQSTPHTRASQVLHPTMGSFTRGQHSWGSLTQCSWVRFQ